MPQRNCKQLFVCLVYQGCIFCKSLASLREEQRDVNLIRIQGWLKKHHSLILMQMSKKKFTILIANKGISTLKCILSHFHISASWCTCIVHHGSFDNQCLKNAIKLSIWKNLLIKNLSKYNYIIYHSWGNFKTISQKFLTQLTI